MFSKGDEVVVLSTEGLVDEGMRGIINFKYSSTQYNAIFFIESGKFEFQGIVSEDNIRKV